MEEKLKLYLKSMISNKGSDLHLKSGAITRVRIDGVLKQLGKEALASSEIDSMIREITSKDQYIRLQEDKNLDFTYILGEDYRFRVNVFYQMDGLSAVFRVIPVKILNLDDLKLPSIIKKFTKAQRGLVLVTGVTGSGKSTTLAAIIDKINRENKKHIITIEDPIEFIHKDRGCLINQRAIGQDTHSFSDALRAALREDPDIILVGEMRDLETIDIALHAANTGHLVFSTLHTNDAVSAITRIVDMGIEPYLVSGALVAIQAQRLVRKLCPHCKSPTTLPDDIMEHISVYIPKSGYQFYKAKGCDKCMGSGYMGREMVSEVLVIDDTLQSMIARGESKEAMLEYELNQGFLTMFADATIRACQGKNNN